MINLGKVLALMLVIAVAGASPVAAGPSPNGSTTYTIYHGGVSALERTESLVSGVLKGTFSLFNPCLDVVKGCTSIVLAPIEYPLTYFSPSKKWVVTKSTKVPVPKKPELPKQ